MATLSQLVENSAFKFKITAQYTMELQLLQVQCNTIVQNLHGNPVLSSVHYNVTLHNQIRRQKHIGCAESF